MGMQDTLSMEYLSDNKRFADICNYCLFEGRSVIQPENLQTVNTKEFLELAGLDGKGIQIQRIRDILKTAVIRSTAKCTYLIIGVENQTHIHYAMPVRGMIYDALNYGRQVNVIGARHHDAKDLKNKTEYLSAFTTNDYLTPVVTITVYWGADVWDAPRSLHEMFQTDSSLLKYVADYRLNLISPAEITDFEKFKTSVGPVLEVMKCLNDEAAMEQIITGKIAFESLEYDAVKVINGFANLGLKLDENEEEINMCKAWEDHRKRGETCKLIELSIKKFEKQIPVAEVADMLEEDEAFIQQIYDVTQAYTPDYDANKIYDQMMKNNHSA